MTPSPIQATLLIAFSPFFELDASVVSDRAVLKVF